MGGRSGKDIDTDIHNIEFYSMYTRCLEHISISTMFQLKVLGIRWTWHEQLFNLSSDSGQLTAVRLGHPKQPSAFRRTGGAILGAGDSGNHFGKVDSHTNYALALFGQQELGPQGIKMVVSSSFVWENLCYSIRITYLAMNVFSGHPGSAGA